MVSIPNPDKWYRPSPNVYAVPAQHEYKSYDQYAVAYDAYLKNQLEQLKLLRKTVKCPQKIKTIVKEFDQTLLREVDVERLTPLHVEAEYSFACQHVIEQAVQDRPNGIVVYDGFYVCRDCHDLILRWKFKHGDELVVMCHPCVDQALKHVMQIDPSLVIINKKS